MTAATPAPPTVVGSAGAASKGDTIEWLRVLLVILPLAEHARIRMAPHFAMEIHLHLAASYPHGPWVEHFEWLEPMFNERLAISGGRMQLPTRPGLGISLSQQARAWTAASAEFGPRR